ncbi:tRNA (cytosine(34)-C(5))-methyltransferase-like [Papaver somniferum]|nr:tRNA (cytosine(34)-C(5))-methyltransferase-like [Papaver somniferum]
MENVDSDHVNEQSEILVSPTDALEMEVSDLPLERCMRIVPHDQNTGAFFIAILQKVSPLPAVSSSTKPKETLTNGNHKLPLKVSDEVPRETNSAEPSAISNVESSDGKTEVGATGLNSREVVEEENEKEHTENVNAETDTKKAGGNRRLQNQGKWRGVDPVVFFREDTVLSSIKDFYGISDSFPLNDHLVTRNTDFQSCKRIYYISKSVQDVMKLNFQVGQQLKIISIGLKAFERQTVKEDSASECMYRISSEGLPLLLPYISKQILCASLADFKHLLQYRSIKFQDFVNPQFGEKASSEIKLGCCIVVLQTEDQPTSKPMDASTIAIGCWRGKSSVSVMVPETDCQELLERLSARLGFEMVPVKEKPTVRRGKKDDAEEKLVKEPVEEEAIVG